MRRIDRDRYMFIFEKRYLDKIVADRFDLVEQIHETVSPTGIRATVSLGVGEDGAGYEENYSFASLAADMALSRGGDQAVIKNKYNFEFFGGRGSEVETRTKVKSRVMANSLSQLIADAGEVFVMGHRFADLDAVGAAVGVSCIARTLGKPARIVIDEHHNASGALLERLRADEEYQNAFLSPQDAILQANEKTLLVVVDTHRPEQVEDKDLLEACGNRLALIDHHRRAATYIENAALTLYEPNASSTCELETELIEELVEQKDIRPLEANAILSGIVLDTKNFTMRTGGRTFEAAAFLRRAGADTADVQRLFQSDLSGMLERYNIIRHAELFREDIAIAAVEEEIDRVTAAKAADELLTLQGVRASFVLFKKGTGVNLSARSLGEINVQLIMEKLGGGGNSTTAGGQVPDTTVDAVYEQLVRAIEEYLEN
jgi:c-di-AMP phosphodiesterase-like protein